jgi:hypothetical protein
VKPPVIWAWPPGISCSTPASSIRSLSRKIAILLSGGWSLAVATRWLKRSRVRSPNSLAPRELKLMLTSGRPFWSVERLALVIMLPSIWVKTGL